MTTDAERLLVFNSHEGWISLLEGCGYELDLVVGLAGRPVRGWDLRQRPLPRGARTIAIEHLEEEGRNPSRWAAAVCHNITDLLTVRTFDLPKLFVLHKSLASSQQEQGGTVGLDEVHTKLRRYLEHTQAHAVAVSTWKAETSGITQDVLLPGIDPDDYLPWTGDRAAGIRVSHQVDARRATLAMDLHDRAFAGVPLELVGWNPTRPGVSISRDHDHLKWLLSRHRFIVHTADPELEDGFNLALLEGMAAGLPVIGNRHPSSPVRHGEEGWLSDDPAELREFALTLIRDRDRAEAMGRKARECVRQEFGRSRFHHGFREAIEAARRRHAGAPIATAASAAKLSDPAR